MSTKSSVVRPDSSASSSVSLPFDKFITIVFCSLGIVKETESAMESVTVVEQSQECEQANYKVSS